MEDFVQEIYAYRPDFIHSNPIYCENDTLDTVLIVDENNKCKMNTTLKILTTASCIGLTGLIGITGFLFFYK